MDENGMDGNGPGWWEGQQKGSFPTASDECHVKQKPEGRRCDRWEGEREAAASICTSDGTSSLQTHSPGIQRSRGKQSDSPKVTEQVSVRARSPESRCWALITLLQEGPEPLSRTRCSCQVLATASSDRARQPEGASGLARSRLVWIRLRSTRPSLGHQGQTMEAVSKHRGRDGADSQPSPRPHTPLTQPGKPAMERSVRSSGF